MDKNTKYNLASSLRASADSLAKLAEDTSSLVREAVASNPNTTEEALTTLTNDKIQYVSEAAITRRFNGEQHDNSL